MVRGPSERGDLVYGHKIILNHSRSAEIANSSNGLLLKNRRKKPATNTQIALICTIHAANDFNMLTMNATVIVISRHPRNN